MSRYTCFVREISVIERYSKGQQLELFSFFSIFTRSFCNYNEDNNESRDVDVEFAFKKKKADKYEQIYIYIYIVWRSVILFINERFLEILIETSRLSDSPLKVYRLIDRKRSVRIGDGSRQSELSSPSLPR